jgi:cytoskeletal protein RodZ
VEAGQQLFEARQRRGLTLDYISRTTKIPVSVLQAIERNDEARLPQEFFRRAFVRAYANEVGLNAEDLLNDSDVEYSANLPVSNGAADESAPSRSLFFVAVAAACIIYYGYALQQTPQSIPQAAEAAAVRPGETVSSTDRGDITLPAVAPEPIAGPFATLKSARPAPIEASADRLADSSSAAAVPVTHIDTTDAAVASPAAAESSPVVSDAVLPEPDVAPSPAPVEQF